MNYCPTKTDLNNIEELKNGGSVFSENKGWAVHDYGKKGGFVLLIQRENDHSFELKTKKDLINFLHGIEVKNIKKLELPKF